MPTLFQAHTLSTALVSVCVVLSNRDLPNELRVVMFATLNQYWDLEVESNSDSKQIKIKIYG